MSQASPAAFLSLRSISKVFGGVRALDEVSLDIFPGEVHCLAGENGSGKSTLVKLIAGVHRPQAGGIHVGGVDRTHLTPVQSVGLGIQVIYQDLSLFPNLTVSENLALNTIIENGRRLVRWRDVRRTAERAAELLHVRWDLNCLVGDLPIAQRQLVAIGRALVQDARLVILDEPTTALTAVEIDAFLDVVGRLRAQGVAFLFVSHKMREMLHASDRFTVLRNGAVVASGPRHEFDEARLTLAMTGRNPSSPRVAAPHPRTGSPLLRVTDARGAALRGVQFELHAGEIVGATGRLGAGQTDLALMLAGLGRWTGGTLAIDGQIQRDWTIDAARAAGIAYVPEDRLREGLFLDRSIAHNTNASTLRSLRGRFGLLSRAGARAQVAHWMRVLNVKLPSAEAPARALSGGNQQRVVLAKALSTRPRLLVLSGPTVGVDVGAKDEIHQTIRELAQQGLGVLLISDDLAELTHTCHRVLVMHQGVIVDELSEGALSEESLRERLGALDAIGEPWSRPA